MNELLIINEENIQNKIYTIRGVQVMLDRDLAELYDVDTKVLNQAVKRNEARFPHDFRFQLTMQEKDEPVTNCDRLNSLKHSSVNPYVFTEQGISELMFDLQKHNAQYPHIIVKEFKDAHDRFLILDEKEIYHIGASLKDLGKKWFAFSKFESSALEMLGRLK
jgi:hypothetical protein